MNNEKNQEMTMRGQTVKYTQEHVEKQMKKFKQHCPQGEIKLVTDSILSNGILVVEAKIWRDFANNKGIANAFGCISTNETNRTALLDAQLCAIGLALDLAEINDHWQKMKPEQYGASSDEFAAEDISSADNIECKEKTIEKNQLEEPEKPKNLDESTLKKEQALEDSKNEANQTAQQSSAKKEDTPSQQIIQPEEPAPNEPSNLNESSIDSNTNNEISRLESQQSNSTLNLNQNNQSEMDPEPDSSDPELEKALNTICTLTVNNGDKLWEIYLGNPSFFKYLMAFCCKEDLKAAAQYISNHKEAAEKYISTHCSNQRAK